VRDDVLNYAFAKA